MLVDSEVDISFHWIRKKVILNMMDTSQTSDERAMFRSFSIVRPVIFSLVIAWPFVVLMFYS